MANNHPVFIFPPIPFLFSLECTIPSCLFGNFNGSSGRPGDQNDVWLFIMKEKIVRVAACPTTPSNAGWSLKIVLLSIMLFQLEIIWIFLFDGSSGLRTHKYSVGIWMAFMRIWVGYNGKVQLWNEWSESQNVGMATVLYVGYWLATHWKAEVLLCVFYLSACMQFHIHRMRELYWILHARFRGRTCRTILDVDSRWVYNVFLLLTVTLWCILKRPMTNMKLFHCNTEIGWPNVTRSITIFTNTFTCSLLRLANHLGPADVLVRMMLLSLSLWQLTIESAMRTQNCEFNVLLLKLIVHVRLYVFVINEI